MWRSTRRHDGTEFPTRTSSTHAIAWIELDDDPRRYLLAGPDRGGNLLELVALAAPDAVLVIHAMPLRLTTRRELFGDET